MKKVYIQAWYTAQILYKILDGDKNLYIFL